MKKNTILSLLAISILGMISVVLPTLFLKDLKPYDSPVFPLLRTGIEGISIYSFGILLLSGFIVKLWSKVSSWKIGLMSMILFPFAAIIEVIIDHSSHNMFPFELIIYALMTIPAIAGAYSAQLIQRMARKKRS